MHSKYMEWMKQETVSCDLLIKFIGDNGNKELKNQYEKETKKTEELFKLYKESIK